MAATTRKECAGCGGELGMVLDLGSSPLADHFPASPEEDGPSYPLRMAACEVCTLVQLLDVVDDDELFGEDYGFYTSGSPALLTYYKDWAKWAWNACHPKTVVDIGCNDGTLLHSFRALPGVEKVIGVDPARPAETARGTGGPVYRQPWNRVTADQVRDEHGPADLITGINVAAHVDDPVAFLRAIEATLKPHGHAVIEFQDLAHLVAGCQFDHVYHEHRFFYSARTFLQLARQANLAAVEIMPTPGQGGSTRIVLRRENGKIGVLKHVEPMTSYRQLGALQARAEWTRSQLHVLLREAMDRGAVAGYAASAKSATLLNYCKIDHAILDFVEDATRWKWGRYTPGTHIPITPEGKRHVPKTYLLLAWNFLPQVIRREQQYLNNGGKLIVPVPVPFVI